MIVSYRKASIRYARKKPVHLLNPEILKIARSIRKSFLRKHPRNKVLLNCCGRWSDATVAALKKAGFKSEYVRTGFWGDPMWGSKRRRHHSDHVVVKCGDYFIDGTATQFKNMIKGRIPALVVVTTEHEWYSSTTNAGA